MGTEISLFSKKSFIEASKKFVRVRLGTYESKKHQDMIRSLLHGKMMNTAFVVSPLMERRSYLDLEEAQIMHLARMSSAA